MAKSLLWAFVVMGVFIMTVDVLISEIYLKNVNWVAYSTFASICILALCESIERLGGKK